MRSLPNRDSYFGGADRVILHAYHRRATPTITRRLNPPDGVATTMTGARSTAFGPVAQGKGRADEDTYGNSATTNTFDELTALEQWVEQKKAPERLVASHLTNGAVDRTRPLCPYPQVAVYQGTGSTDDAANFVCKVR